VLERTSGPACGRAEHLLCDFVDGLLPAGQAAVLADHLDHCAACRSLAEALRGMSDVLAGLATLDPGAGFADAVLARTSLAAAGRAPSRSQRWRELPQRLAGAWDRLLARPRIGFELGYVGALLILLVFGNPAATVQAASERLSRPPAGLGQLGALPGAILSLDVSRAAGEVARLDRVSAELSERRTALTQETKGWWATVSGMLESVWNTGRGALAWLVREVGDAWVRLQDALADWMARAAAARRPEPGEPSGR
jgi:hypothetical protein